MSFEVALGSASDDVVAEGNVDGAALRFSSSRDFDKSKACERGSPTNRAKPCRLAVAIVSDLYFA